MQAARPEAPEQQKLQMKRAPASTSALSSTEGEL